MNRHPLEPRRPLAPAFIGGALAALGIGAAVFWAMFVIRPPIGWWPAQDAPFRADLHWLGGYLAAAFAPPASHDLLSFVSWPELIVARLGGWLAAYDLRTRLLLRVGAVLLAAIGAGAIAGVGFHRSTAPHDRTIHLSNRRLHAGRRALCELRRHLRPELRHSGSRVKLAPGLRWPTGRELQHLGLFGMTGGGKTVILHYLMSQLLARGDRMIVLDAKGDMTSGLPDGFLLLAPQDRRGWVWQLGLDIRSAADARELAARIVPQSHDPLWSSGARELLVGVAKSLIKDHGTDWYWDDLLARLVEDPAKLKARLEPIHPAAAAMLAIDADGQATRTSHSLWLTLAAAAQATLAPLAQAWGRAAEGPRIGLREWLDDGLEDLPRVLVLQRAASQPGMSEAWMGLAIALMASRMADPAYPSGPEPSLTWVLDEAPQLGAVKELEQLLAVGREKGQAVILAAQDIEQLVKLYGEPGARAILNNLGTKIICRQASGPSAERVVREFIGKRRVAWQAVSHGEARGFAPRPRHTQLEHAEIDVASPRFVEAELGLEASLGRPMIRALLLGLGDAFLLRWPIQSWPKRREAHLAADWLRDESDAAR